MDDKIGTLHADLRLMQRAREFDKSLTELWDEGVECEVAYHGYDEARVIPSHEIVMLVEGGQVITILDDLHNVTVEGQNFQDYLGGVLDAERPE
jgi:uncharacterized protein (UPF0248 family)